LAGVLFGEGGGRTAGSYCGRVQWFLAGLAPPDAADPAGDMLAAATAPTAPLGAQAISDPRTQAPPFNPLAPPAHPGARVNSLAALGLPAAGQTSNAASAAPPRAIARSATYASTAAPARSGLTAQNAGWQSAPPRGLANPDRDPPQPRPRPVAPDSELVEVTHVRGIPDAAAFGEIARTANPPASVRQDSPDEAPDEQRGIAWTDIAGHTLGEQIKTILATIGGLAVFMQAISLLSRDANPVKKTADDEDDD